MSPRRRRLLRLLPAGFVGLAGCGGGGEADDDGLDRGRSRGSVTDPPVVRARNPGGERAVLGPDADGSRFDGLVRRRETARGLAVADGVPAADGEAVRSFLAATDLDRETIYVAHFFPKSCYRSRVRSLSWGPGEIKYSYCQELRPPDARCEPDRRDAVGLVFRIPAVVGAEISSSGTRGSRPCRGVDTDYSRVDTTPAGWRESANRTATKSANRTAIGGDGL